ncbi:hypothetical protein [Rathayibacter rathayi]|uniref:hypothetical protein n=1 Tax=Rathayibacter rathayi TaxID=33887 RepID=UPI0011B086F2|nr:hypothetical protein [Rathayibacter rathayi]MWV75839.1 hypothetical protein [Rathayibacter rathayi NCPPB 2980 = VKM Ac-1601]
MDAAMCRVFLYGISSLVVWLVTTMVGFTQSWWVTTVMGMILGELSIVVMKGVMRQGEDKRRAAEAKIRSQALNQEIRDALSMLSEKLPPT